MIKLVKTFFIIYIALCLSTAITSQEFTSFSERIWTQDKNFSDKPIQGFAINIFSNEDTIAIPVFDKKNTECYSLLKSNDSPWKKIDAMSWGNLVMGEKDVVIAHFDSISSRQQWQVSKISLDTFLPVSTHKIPPHEKIDYVHQISLAQTANADLYALGGIYNGYDNANFYEICHSNDTGKTWSTAKKCLEGFSAHDDGPTVFKAFGNNLLFFGYSRNNETEEESGGKLVTITNTTYNAITLPHNNVWLMNFQENNNILHAIYGIKKEDWKMDIYYSSTSDLKSWSEPILLVKNITMEDVLMQMPPRLLVNGNQLLTVFADIHGSWTRGEFTYRFFISEDGGKTWSQMPSPDSLGKFASIALCYNGDDILAAVGKGSFRNMKTEIWRWTKKDE